MNVEDNRHIQSLIDNGHDVICKSGWMCCGRLMPPDDDFIRRTYAATQREIDRIMMLSGEGLVGF